MINSSTYFIPCFEILIYLDFKKDILWHGLNKTETTEKTK